jgi:hypothetical protein
MLFGVRAGLGISTLVSADETVLEESAGNLNALPDESSLSPCFRLGLRAICGVFPADTTPGLRRAGLIGKWLGVGSGVEVGLMVSYNGEGCRGDVKAIAGLLG